MALLRVQTSSSRCFRMIIGELRGDDSDFLLPGQSASARRVAFEAQIPYQGASIHCNSILVTPFAPILSS
jgi:hypothetical protein